MGGEASAAPTYLIPPRQIVAVEHPMIIENIDIGLKTFGKEKPFARILNECDPEGSLPLYLRHNDPMCSPLFSHNCSTKNVVLKITVPKCTGKRKRASQESYLGIGPRFTPTEIDISVQNDLCSHSRIDGPKKLLRSLKDNADNYQVEAVAEVKRTHRFRGLSDFHHSTTHSEFAAKIQKFLLPGDAEKMRNFNFDPARGYKNNEDFLPPPVLTSETLPFNWAYQQNPHVLTGVNEATGEIFLANKSKIRKIMLKYLPADVKSIPQNSPFPMPKDDAQRSVILKLEEALAERPVWSRRALGNRVGHEELPVAILKVLHHVAYQFKGGPFRDAVIKYGIDPRTDKKYYRYQTLFFKLYEEDKSGLKKWKDIRTTIPLNSNVVRKNTMTHIFDGKKLALDGKVWQLCDITDPLLERLVSGAHLRDECDNKGDGWLSNGSMAKIHSIMRTKLIALRARVPIATIDALDFQPALDIPDVHENNSKESHRIFVPVPDIQLKDEQVQEMIDEGMDISFLRQNAISKRSRKLRNERIAKKISPNKSFARKHLLGAKHSSKEGGANQEEVARNEDSAVHGLNGSQVRQTNSLSEEYLTAEDKVKCANNGEGNDERLDGDGSDGRDSDDMNSEERDDSGSGSESDEGDLVNGEEQEDSGNDTTDDIVDSAVRFNPLS